MHTSTATKEDPMKNETIAARIRESQQRITKLLHAVHAQRDPECRTWERYSIPAHGGGRMEGVGCRQHDIFTTAGR